MLNIPRFDRRDLIDAMLYAMVKITPSEWFPKHATRTRPAYLQAHPLVVSLCWFLRRWIWIAPWTVYQIPDDADPIYIRDANTIVCSPRQYQAMKRHIPTTGNNHEQR